MEFFVYLIFIGSFLISPVLSIIIGMTYWMFSRKYNIFYTITLSIIVGYICFTYVYRPIDDMARYIFYMNGISNSENIFSYLKMNYTNEGFSIYGVNAKNWPLSGIILYITQKYFDYRYLASFSIGFSFFTRLFLIKRIIPEARPLYKFLFLVALLLPAYPIFLMSAFRWWLSLAVALIAISYDRNRFEDKEFVGVVPIDKLSMLLYIISGLIHPSGYIYLAIRLFSGYIVSSGKNLKKIIYIILSILFIVVGFILSTRFGLRAQALAYIRFDLSVYSFAFNLVIVSISLISYYYIYCNKNMISKIFYRYIQITQIITFCIFPFKLFERLYPFMISLTIIGLLYTFKSENKKIPFLLIVSVVSFISFFIIFYILQPGRVFPQINNFLSRLFMSPFLLE